MKEDKYILKEINNMIKIRLLLLLSILSLSCLIPSISAVSCSIEGNYQCDPSDFNIVQKCIGGVWTGWQSCTYGCSDGSCIPASGCYLNETYKCNPYYNDTLQKCINNIWINWQSCAYGCNFLTSSCNYPPTTSLPSTITTTTLPGSIPTTSTTTTIPNIAGNVVFYDQITDTETGQSSYGLWSTTNYIYRTDKDNNKINQFNKTTLSFIRTIASSTISSGTWNGTHNFVANLTDNPRTYVNIYDENFTTLYTSWNVTDICSIGNAMYGITYDYKENVIWGNCLYVNSANLTKSNATTGGFLGSFSYPYSAVTGWRMLDLDFDGQYVLFANYYDTGNNGLPVGIYLLNQTRAFNDKSYGAINGNSSYIITSITNVPTNVGSIGFANGMLFAGPDYLTSGYYWRYNYSLVPDVYCGSEGNYRCNPYDNSILQKCINSTWTGWSSCAYNCSDNQCISPEITQNITLYCYGEGSYQCGLDNTTLYKCVNNTLVGWQSCALGCDVLTLACRITYTAPTNLTESSKNPLFSFSSLNPKMNFMDMIFTPFFLLTMMAMGISGYVSTQTADKNAGEHMNANIFGISMMIFVLAFTYFGIYPIWIGLVLIILIALWIAKIFGVIKGVS